MRRIVLCGFSLSFALAVAALACGDDEQASPPTNATEAGPGATAPTDSGSFATPESGTDAGPPSYVGPERSGSRLKSQGVQTAEGFFIAAPSLYDSKLDTSCVFGTSTDGSIRCVPSTIAVIAGYADDQCTSRIAAIPARTCTQIFEQPNPKFVTVETTNPTNACDKRRTTYKIGVNVLPTKIFVKQPAGGGCAEMPFVAQPNTSYHAADDVLPDADLVKGAIVDVPGSSRIHISVFEGEDGARVARGFSDAQRNKACAVTFSEGVVRCLPRSLPITDVFGDSACTMTFARLTPTCVTPNDPIDEMTAVTNEGSFFDPDRRARVFSLGAKGVAASPIYGRTFDGGIPSVCAATTIAPEDVYALGTEITLDNFPEVTKAKIGGPRLVVDAYDSAGAKLIDVASGSPTLTDTLTTTCTFLKAEDGIVRCLPNGDKYRAMVDPITCQTAIFDGASKLPPGSFLQGNWTRK